MRYPKCGRKPEETVQQQVRIGAGDRVWLSWLPEAGVVMSQ